MSYIIYTYIWTMFSHMIVSNDQSSVQLCWTFRAVDSHQASIILLLNRASVKRDHSTHETSNTLLATGEEYSFGGYKSGTFVWRVYLYGFCELLNAFAWGYKGICCLIYICRILHCDFTLAPRVRILPESCWLHFDQKRGVATPRAAINGHNIIWCKVFYISF